MWFLIDAYLVPAGIALVIGVATGWWAFRHRRHAASDPLIAPEKFNRED